MDGYNIKVQTKLWKVNTGIIEHLFFNESISDLVSDKTDFGEMKGFFKMSDRENHVQYCDIDPEWESEYILLFLSEDRLKSTTELAYLKRYRAFSSAYHDKERLILKYTHMVSEMESRIKKVNRDGLIDADDITSSCIKDICNLQSKIDEESAHLLTYENELAKLENTEIIKKIVEREGPDDLILEMTYAKTTLNRTEEKNNSKTKKKVFKRILELLR